MGTYHIYCNVVIVLHCIIRIGIRYILHILSYLIFLHCGLFDLQDDFPHGSHHKEVAISISNYTLKHGDTGLIIVGGSMEVQPQVPSSLDSEFMF